ncbi:MAG TPA: Holliday junction branch migration protein RuvA [Candidatus Dormibacteraeota bacterium]|nr:Holliday junction branch migration protein RuvA [Candidatus Dormibacteraeota bacterium]
MIALLSGRVAALDGSTAIIDTGGVGYEVGCHLRTVAALHEWSVGEVPVTLHIHTSVSADAIRLYGFLGAAELRLFRLLLGVERIGPKAALGILGRADLPTLVRALRSGDVALLATVPGIGRKTAERIVLELRDRLDDMALPGDGAATAPEQRTVAAAVEGLVALGFREPEARAAVAAGVAESGTEAAVGALVAAALRRLDRVPT